MHAGGGGGNLKPVASEMAERVTPDFSLLVVVAASAVVTMLLLLLLLLLLSCDQRLKRDCSWRRW